MADVVTDVPLRHNRDFKLLWAGGTLAGLGSLIGNLAVPLLVLQQTGSAAQAGVVGSVSAVALLVASIPAGAAADAVERRRLMIWSQLGGVLAAAVLVGGVLAGHPGLPLILGVTIAVAVLGSLYAPASMGLIQAAVPASQLGLAMSSLQARTAALQVVGPLAGGVVFSISPVLPFTVRAGALLASVLCLLAVRARSVPDPAPITMPHLTAGIRFIWGQRYLRTILLVFGAGVGTVFAAVMLVALAAATETDPSGRSSGVLVALTAAGSLAGALLAPRLRAADRPHRALTLTCWCLAATVPLLALVASRPAVIGTLLGVSMLIAAVGSVAFETEMLRLTPPDLVGRSEAGQLFISTLAAPLGPIGGGLLADRYGAPTAFVAFGVVLAALAMILTLTLSRAGTDDCPSSTPDRCRGDAC
jgi:MFS family permease